MVCHGRPAGSGLVPRSRSRARRARRRRHALCGAAATLLRPDNGASGATAATMHGLPTMAIPNVPELTSRTPDWLGRRSASHLRSAALAADDVTTWHGAPLTTMAR